MFQRWRAPHSVPPQSKAIRSAPRALLASLGNAVPITPRNARYARKLSWVRRECKTRRLFALTSAKYWLKTRCTVLRSRVSVYVMPVVKSYRKFPIIAVPSSQSNSIVNHPRWLNYRFSADPATGDKATLLSLLLLPDTLNDYSPVITLFETESLNGRLANKTYTRQQVGLFFALSLNCAL